MNNWKILTKDQKIKFKEYCDKKYGKTYTFCETCEPLYLDEECNLINTQLVIELLFSTTKN